MNWFVIILFIIICKTSCDVQYASGYAAQWYAVIYNVGSTYDQTITFPQQFSRVPQVSINPLIIKFPYNSAAVELGYELSIKSITTSNFIVTVKPISGAIQYLTLYWIAVDDKRIEILTNFNVANPKSTPLQHNNVNANKGIIFFTSFDGTTKVDFTLSLGSITPTTVQVNIVQQNMKSLGYIVILGPSEFFDIESEIIGPPLDNSNSASYKSRTVTNVSNKIWFFFLKYFTFKVERNFALQAVPSFEATQTSYQYQSWDTTTYLGFLNGCHQCATLNFVLTTLKPILFQKLRITGIILFEQTNIIEFSIPLVSKTYTQQVGSDQISIPQNTATLMFILRVRCNKNYKITAQYYQCDSPCSNQYKQTIRYCGDSENTLQFFVTYRSQNAAFYQSLNVIVATSQIKVYQTVVNQVESQILICQYDIE